MKMLLGFNKENKSLFFGKYEIRNGEFSASFSEVGLLEVNNKVLKWRAENILDSTDFEFVKRIANKYNVSVKENDFDLADKIELIAEKWINDYYVGVEEFLDTSLYYEYFTFNDKDYYFESIGVGQLDIDRYNIEFVFPKFAKELIKLWNDYHLQEIPKNNFNNFVKLYEECYNDFDEYEYIEGLVEEWVVNE